MKFKLVYAFVFLFLAGAVSACVSYPSIETSNTDCQRIIFNQYYTSESDVVNILNSNKTLCNFSDEDISILGDYVLNGYSVKEQTMEEYISFLQEVKYNNSLVPVSCVDYLAIDRYGKWTTFIRSGKQYVNKDCISAKCSGAVFNIFANVLDQQGGCKNLYWIDNENKSCGQQEFCGAYMYYGLQTFETKGECESASERNYCTSRPEICTLEYMPVCGNDGETYGNGCGACGAGVEYWTSGECGEQNEKQFFDLSNGRKAEIKIMPETASERAIERLGELNFTVVLKEVGANRTAYELTGEKQGKFLGLFKVKTNVSIEVNAETGEVLKMKKPWWAFLASGI